MKQKLVVLFFLLTGLVACDKEVSGTLTYMVNLFSVDYSISMSEKSDVGRLYEEYQQSERKITAKYAKEWQYAYSGRTFEEALADEDRRAVANSNFDAAVAEYEALAEKLKNTRQDLEGGSFRIVTVFKIIRFDKTIKESKELVFEYPSGQ